MNLQSGAFGDPTNLSTLILFWSKMEMLHYPGASETRAYLEEELKRQEAVAEQQAMMRGIGTQQAMPMVSPEAVNKRGEGGMIR